MFHAEAGIAADALCGRIVRANPLAGDCRSILSGDCRSILYGMVERIAPSPLHTLNRAVAVAEWQGPEVGLALIDGIAASARLSGSYLWEAVLGDLHRRAGHSEIAQHHRERALSSAPTDTLRDLLRRRLTAPD